MSECVRECVRETVRVSEMAQSPTVALVQERGECGGCGVRVDHGGAHPPAPDHLSVCASRDIRARVLTVLTKVNTATTYSLTHTHTHSLTHRIAECTDALRQAALLSLGRQHGHHPSTCRGAAEGCRNQWVHGMTVYHNHGAHMSSACCTGRPSDAMSAP